MTTVSDDDGQTPLETVQRSDVFPVEIPLQVDVGEDGFKKLAVPEITVHNPVPVVGVVADNVVLSPQIEKLFPALAVDGGEKTVMITVSREAGQTVVEITHSKTF